jgi:hypothetical protein
MSELQKKAPGGSGAVLEASVLSTFSTLNFSVLKNKEYEALAARGAPLSRVLVRHRPYTTIYKTTGTTEFWLSSPDARATKEFPSPRPPEPFICRIECKWQQSAGSVDEKFPYLYLSCVETMPEENVILLVQAQGARREAVQWLRDAVERRPYANDRGRAKNIRMMDLAEFMTWANRAFGR